MEKKVSSEEVAQCVVTLKKLTGIFTEKKCLETHLPKNFSELLKQAKHLICFQPQRFIKRKFLDENEQDQLLLLEEKEKVQKKEAPKEAKPCHKRRCYVCKGVVWNDKTQVNHSHSFYPQMCLECGDFNFAKRMQTKDLTGKIAVVTGCRIKIGYEIMLKLLRSGCRVIGTTRFPQDAALRFSKEDDFLQWKDHLELYALDLKRLGDVHVFLEHLKSKLPELHILINNAAQTISRPEAYYTHLKDIETTPLLDSAVQALIPSSPLKTMFIENHSHEMIEKQQQQQHLFPVGEKDQDGQQLDLRKTNSWMASLGKISTEEMVEVHAINTFAPFIFCSELSKIMEKTPGKKFIINVSAMEGQFSRYKTPNHPHTNMAKAALNMLTRTSACKLVNSNIFMTAVDTGWVTDERPHHMKTQDTFVPPLDCLDGAMRCLDPIFTESEHFGIFLKDYTLTMW
jgi:NAD(P)-dependent dehydrogenase (short-subunit alcohol dehydrogenase family)